MLPPPNPGEGQLEMPLSPQFGIKAPDSATTFRTGVKEIASQTGLLASFLSVPYSAGNGGHFNISLWEASSEAADAEDGEWGTGGKRNVLFSQKVEGPSRAASQTASTYTLSPFGECFVAGLLSHAAGLEALCSPTPSCYSRHGHWAPTHCDWGYDSRLAAVRIKCGRIPSDCYLELRLPSSSSNPYLVLATAIAAGRCSKSALCN